MEKVENFYLQIVAELKSLQSERLNKERALPLNVNVHQKFKDTWFAIRKQKKAEKQRQKIEKGYYKAINECLKRISEIYKEMLKECSSD